MKTKNILTLIMLLFTGVAFGQEVDPATQMSSMIYFSFITIIVIIAMVIVGNYINQRKQRNQGTKVRKAAIGSKLVTTIIAIVALIVVGFYLSMSDLYAVVAWSVFALVVVHQLVTALLNYREAAQELPSAEVAEEEQVEDVLLDHDYDGIKELDNNLPSWWLYGFYACIGFALLYLYDYHIAATSPLSAQEYEIEMQEAVTSVSENTLIVEVAQLTDEASLASGKKIYDLNCVACHLTNGAGSVGPNLTDEYWVHGGDFNSVVKVINDGVLEKGMIAWKASLNPTQINEVASYLLTLPKAEGKAPEGELYTEN